jgi:hypothetical protein
VVFWSAPLSSIHMGDYCGSGIDQKPIEQITDRSNALFYGTDPDEIRKGVATRIATMEDPSKLVCGLVSSRPIDSAELMKEVLVAAFEAGGRRFSYCNYGMTPMRHLRWLGDAVAAVRALDAQE